MRTLLAALLLVAATSANAEEIIGKAKAKGLVFKDEIQVVAFDDPDIKGVTCYVTYYDRALSFSDSTSSSIACRQVGPVSGNLGPRDSVFAQSTNPFFKKRVVQRFYDAKRKVLIYLAFTTATSGDSAGHSISVVPVK